MRFADDVDRLGDIAAELESCESTDEVYDHALTAASRVLNFEAASVVTQEGEHLVPRAVHSTRLVPGEPLSAADGIAGRTFETGRTHVVGDLAEDDVAVPSCDTFRSVLSIPIEDRGVLQFLSCEPNAFSTLDRELGELLVTTVVNALARVSYETALSRERDQFAALFENIPDAALQYRVVDGEHRIETVNTSFVRVFGLDVEAVVGEPIAAALETQDGHTPGHRGETAGDVSGDEDVEIVVETATGPRPFLLRTVPIATDADQERGYRIYTDLTALKVREQELERQNERLDQFASIVSHDLRNPLAVANGYLELVRDELGDDHDAVTEIQQAHGRMEELIDDVLTVARETNQIDTLEPVHLHSIATRAWEHVETRYAQLELDDAEGWIDADPNRLLQLFENVFRNAVEHAASDDESDEGVIVRVTTDEDGFGIEDNGSGIPSERREDIFASGYTSETANTGLGLAIVKRIVEEHEWSVNVSDGTMGGARFAITGVRYRDPPEHASGIPP
ncbi:sensor histidine kinase [Natronosalvus vescus]|uniref:sensor histidine kinase n=1 Tax=Natronosalvus vescus TaxID=2953881 RepID=UPI00209105E9|nr:ATP-binding protein [Natronosalvus vescus]